MQYNPTGPDHIKESLISSIHSLIPRVAMILLNRVLMMSKHYGCVF